MREAWNALDAVYTDVATRARGAGTLHVSFPLVPTSLNHQYVQRARGVRDLHPSIKLLRDTVRAKLQPVSVARNGWVPIGKLAVVVSFYGPDWLTKKGTVRDVDIDNKVKPLLDAFELAMGIRDSRFWAVHAFKRDALEDRTEMSVYDLGALV